MVIMKPRLIKNSLVTHGGGGGGEELTFTDDNPRPGNK